MYGTPAISYLGLAAHAAIPDGCELAVHAVDLSAHEAAPEWVHLLPAGEFSGRDGRGPYISDPAAILAAFERYGMDLPGDYDHQSLTADQKQGKVPASGWGKVLEDREGNVWGRVEWIAAAAEAIAAKEYRYLSPVFVHTRAKPHKVVALVRYLERYLEDSHFVAPSTST